MSVSSSRVIRSPTDGKSMPNMRCSDSCHAAPMPRIARPPLTWSSVTAILARTAGCRYVTPVTSVPTCKPPGGRGEGGDGDPPIELRAGRDRSLVARAGTGPERDEVVERERGVEAELVGSQPHVAELRVVGVLWRGLDADQHGHSLTYGRPMAAGADALPTNVARATRAMM